MFEHPFDTLVLPQRPYPGGSRQALLALLKAGDAQGIQEAIAHGADPSEPATRHAMPERSTLLMRAAEMGSLQCLLALLPHSDPQATDERGCNALMRAIDAGRAGSSHCVKALIPFTDTLARDLHGHTALRLAVMRPAHACAKALVGVSPQAAHELQGEETLLMIAAARGDLKMLRLLLPGADPLARDPMGRSALMIAALHGNIACVRELLPVSDLMAEDLSSERASQIALSVSEEETHHMLLAEEQRQALCAALPQAPALGARSL